VLPVPPEPPECAQVGLMLVAGDRGSAGVQHQNRARRHSRRSRAEKAAAVGVVYSSGRRVAARDLPRMQVGKLHRLHTAPAYDDGPPLGRA